MAMNSSRSMNVDFMEGLTDRKYKKINGSDRGGVVENTTHEARRDLNDLYYGVNTETPTKTLPDGTVHHTLG